MVVCQALFGYNCVNFIARIAKPHMSVESWIKEHYPTEAKNSAISDLMAARHSLRKWKGYTKEALRRHNIKKPPTTSPDGTTILGSTGCALCQRYIHYENCGNCPIKKQTDCCTIFKDGYPYAEYFNSGDPRKMIEILETCVDKLKSK